jgi:hypothetical protein
MRYISIDPATKSIAILVIDYNNSKILPDEIDTFSNIKIVMTDTTDLAPGIPCKGIKDLDRIDLVVKHLDKIIKPHITDDTLVVIEKQISGTDTYICFVALCTYLRINNTKMYIIAPTFKNTLSIGGERLNYRKYPNSYTANKEHSRAMFLHLKPHFGDATKIDYNKKYEKDLSDCFMQLVYLLIHQ